MDPLSLLMAGTSLGSGALSYLGGNQAAKASRRAGEMALAQSVANAKELKADAYNISRDMENLSRQAYSPYVEGGNRAQSALYDLMGLNGDAARNTARQMFATDPGYQFAYDEGMRALDQSAASRGMLNSGATQKAAMRYGQGLADQQYGSYYNRMADLGRTGLTATNAMMSPIMQGRMGEMNAAGVAANMQNQGGMANAQSVIGASNAQQQGLQGLMSGIQGSLGMMSGSGGLQSLMGNTLKSAQTPTLGTARGSSYLQPNQNYNSGYYGLY